ncbi:DUF1993 domain-containing protein [Microbulbifer sp. A4B17]|nr:DUF1993 domain-containing protein [Microbulbifer sp. A4B17]
MNQINTLLPTYQQMLQALSNWLKKAELTLEKTEAEELLSARLTPDMLPLSSQVRFSCLQAYEGIFRLRGVTLPEFLSELAQEGRNCDSYRDSFSLAQARIGQVLSFLSEVEPESFVEPSDGVVTIEVPGGMIFDMTCDQYIRDWAIPQFYFHINTAYAILRSHRIDLGKADYVRHAFSYLRHGAVS